MEETELLGGFLRRRTDFSGAHVNANRKSSSSHCYGVAQAGHLGMA